MRVCESTGPLGWYYSPTSRTPPPSAHPSICTNVDTTLSCALHCTFLHCTPTRSFSSSFMQAKTPLPVSSIVLRTTTLSARDPAQAVQGITVSDCRDFVTVSSYMQQPTFHLDVPLLSESSRSVRAHMQSRGTADMEHGLGLIIEKHALTRASMEHESKGLGWYRVLGEILYRWPGQIHLLSTFEAPNFGRSERDM